MKNNKKVTIVALLLLIAVTTGVIALTYSRYTSEATGNASAQIAKWSIKVGGTPITTANQTITLTEVNFVPNANVAANKIAPGVTAKIPVELDATGTEVSVDYKIEISGTITVTPSNAKIKLKNGAAVEGTIDKDASNKKKTIEVEIVWENNEANNAADTANGTSTSLTATIPLKVTATQKVA